jgi:putative ABC transport system permease protein
MVQYMALETDNEVPMGLIRNGFAIISLILRRSNSHLGLLLAVWSGLSLAIALIVAIPAYAEASGYRILLASLAENNEDDNVPPFSLVYTYGGASDKPISWQRYQEANAFAASLVDSLNLPSERSVRYGGTEQMRLLPPSGEGKELLFARVSFLSGLQDQTNIIEGSWPKPFNREGPVEVLVADRVANQNTLLVGDTYLLRATSVGLALPVRIAGTWRARDAESSYWFNPPSTYSQMLLVPEESFRMIADNPSVSLVTYASWYSAIEGDNVRSAQVPRITEQITNGTADFQRLLPNVEPRRSPIDALLRHRDQVRVLTVNLALFSVPLLGLLIYFVVQVAGMVVQRQQQEIAVLRSRGGSGVQVLGLAFGEALLLCGASLAAGLALGLGIAHAMLWTQSFLSFVPQPTPPVDLPGASVRYGIYMALLVLPAILLPAFWASRRTIISFKQERARAQAAPLIRQVLSDILLLLPALYGLQQLRLQGLLSVPGISSGADAAGDPFRNPLLLLAPALFVFALAQLVIHLFPQLLALLAWLFGRLPGVAMLLAMRFLARTARGYRAPVLLLTLTLALAAFTASMARTLDTHSVDRAAYAGGADVRLVFQNAGQTGSGDTGAAATSEADPANQGNLDYLFVPPEDYLSIPGVTGVTRAASSRSTLITGSARDAATFLAIDRQTMPEVLAKAWRPGYAGESLGALMNRLADSPEAALISARYAAENGLRTGDVVKLELNDRGAEKDVSFRIVGTVAYFPSLYEEQGPFLIGNLDYSADEQGGLYPYELWLATNPGADLKVIEGYALGNRLEVKEGTPRELLTADLLRPERQGLFGLLSVGFLAAALVTMLGFLIFSLVSFQRRLVELGMLRAIGLSTGQLTALLIVEQALVIGIGTLAGTAFGVQASRLFVPFLQVRTGQFPDTPPFVVQIAWEQIAQIFVVAGTLLVLAVVATVLLLRRMRIFEAVKLGEAV